MTMLQEGSLEYCELLYFILYLLNHDCYSLNMRRINKSELLETPSFPVAKARDI